MSEGLATPPGPYVQVPVDVQYLTWLGWEAFSVLDAAIRKGVVYARRGNLRGDYQSAELVHVDERWPVPTATLIFLVDA